MNSNKHYSFLIGGILNMKVEIINASIIDNLAKKFVLYTFKVFDDDGNVEFTVSKRFSGLKVQPTNSGKSCMIYMFI
jgi:hypothetical protein